VATHELGCQTLNHAGFEPEGVEVAIEVEAYRWHWRPENPRLVLVAESHVYTSPEDVQLTTNLGGLALHPMPG